MRTIIPCVVDKGTRQIILAFTEAVEEVFTEHLQAHNDHGFAPWLLIVVERCETAQERRLMLPLLHLDDCRKLDVEGIHVAAGHDWQSTAYKAATSPKHLGRKQLTVGKVDGSGKGGTSKDVEDVQYVFGGLSQPRREVKKICY